MIHASASGTNKEERAAAKEATRAVFTPPEIVTAFHRRWVNEGGTIKKGTQEVHQVESDEGV